ncbi:unnamed protein product [Phaedon cochleariae]|uniref:Uncharacterized protein n=1 Tax=Phaedon cochleariae TaxID=80249 RepID=A0A9N9SD22_PHACE|nr:unnamed protein product [Phaedon cochleariae]
MCYLDPVDSPKLRPYPNWKAHDKQGPNPPDIVSPSRARADTCGRLWVLDTGLVNILSADTTSAVNPRFVVYNLTTDEIISSYTIPEGQFDKVSSFFGNIAVEENNCTDSFAYLADFGKPALVVYDLAKNRSWQVNHNFFNVDPLAGNLNVSGEGRKDWSRALRALQTF